MDRTLRSEALRYLGYTGQDVDADLDARLGETMALAERELKPRGVWRVFEVERVAGSGAYRLAGSVLELDGETARGFLHDARQVAVLACTLGLQSERRLRALAASDPLGQVLYDAVCTAFVELFLDGLQEEVERWGLEQDLQLGTRFSPGYGDLPLELQPLVLDVLNAERRIGLSVTSDFLLVPMKSVTAFVGLFEGSATDAARQALYGCPTCTLRDSCTLRSRGACCSGARGAVR